MPQGFQYPNDTDVWHRMQWDVAQHSRGAHFMESIVRLKPGVTVEAANNELRALTRRLGQENPSTNGDYTARAVPLATEVVGFFRPALFALFGAAAFLLVITCTNVASLLLARATVREREVAVRAAIGASRGRLVRQFLTESVLLAVMGTALGVAVAVGSVKALVAATPVELPRLAGVGLDARMLLFAVALALLTAIAFGVVPAMLMARGDMQRPLKESGRGGDGGGARRQRAQHAGGRRDRPRRDAARRRGAAGAQLPASGAAGSRLQGRRARSPRRSSCRTRTPTSRRSSTSTIGC